MMPKELFRSLLTTGLIAAGLALTTCAMRPDPKYVPDKYFEEPYKGAAAAIWRRDAYELKRAFQDKDLQVDHIGKANWSLLLYSIACQNSKATRFLLEQGANPNLVNPDTVQIGENVPYPIQAVAYAANEDTYFLKTLLDAGGNPDSKYSTTPALQRAQLIHRTDQKTSEKNIELLLKHGANIEGRDGTGQTALLSAAYLSNWDLVQFFIGEGASWKAYDERGTTLAIIIQNDIAKDIGTPERRRKVRKLKHFLERKGVEFPVERVKVSEAAKEKMRKGFPPNARVDPATGERLDPVKPKPKKSGNRSRFFINEQ